MGNTRWLRSRAAAVAAVALVTVSCAPATRGGATSGHDPSRPIPADLAPQIQNAADVGRRMFVLDSYASRATDAAIASNGGKPDPRVRGWVVAEQGHSAVVTFLSNDGNAVAPVVRVRFASFESTPKVVPAEPGEAATPEEIALFSARETAVAGKFRPCSERYNTVVLPASAAEGGNFVVCLIPATTDPNVVLVGGFHRAVVSADGRTLLSLTPLSKSCLDIPLVQNGVHAEALMASHILGPAPAEHHVFLSLLHRMTFYVATSRGAFAVSGTEMRYLGPLGPSGK